MSISQNDIILLDHVLSQQRQTRAPSSPESQFFEMFVAEQVLKDFDLSFDEIETGIVGNGSDGGVDAIYIFVNGELLTEDFETQTLKKDVSIEVYVMQAKLGAGFSETAVQKLATFTNDLFDLTKKTSDFAALYNQKLRVSVDSFRTAYKNLAARFPKIFFRYLLASKSQAGEPHPNVKKRVEDLRASVKSHFSLADFSFAFLGAPELLVQARKEPTRTFDMSFVEVISTNEGFITLVKLADFHAFIAGENGQLRKNIFESNVRDYQGSTVVNEQIQNTLAQKGNEDFWWLNNGVTVIAAKAVQSGKTLTIEDPQIVNGLQTSTEIYNYGVGASLATDTRKLLVRIVVSTRTDSRDRIIKATNSQTSIPPASLRATERVHRDIEEYLKPYGLFYDRRKNLYRNEGKPIESIVSIPFMAQSVMAILLRRPNDARARPSSLLKKDDDYSQIFDANYPVALYLICARIAKMIQSALRSRVDLIPQDKNNLLFYVVLRLAMNATNSSKPNLSQIAAIDLESIDQEVIQQSVSEVEDLYQTLGASDQVAKGRELVAAVINLPIKATQ